MSISTLGQDPQSFSVAENEDEFACFTDFVGELITEDEFGSCAYILDMVITDNKFWDLCNFI